MENLSSQEQGKKILFLISLPLTPEFKEMRDDVEECLQELHGQGVDVREHIWLEDLAAISNYDIVIIVAHSHPDHPAFVLADGELTFNDFIDSLPSDFKGTLDISSCHSQTMAADIKEKCPDCKMQVALFTVPLLRRILIYPTIVEILNHDSSLDYNKAYDIVSKEFDKILGEVPENQTSDDPMTVLGKKFTAVYAPKQVALNEMFQIIVYIYYNSEKKVIVYRAQQKQTNAEERDEIEIPVDLKVGDIVSVTLSFSQKDYVSIENGGFTKNVSISKDKADATFVVKVLSDYQGNSVMANVKMAKDDYVFVDTYFNINIGDKANAVPAETSEGNSGNENKLKDCMNLYKKICSSKFLHSWNGIYNQVVSEKISYNEKLYKLRSALFNQNLYLDSIKTILKKKSDILNQIQREEGINSTISTQLVHVLRESLNKTKASIENIEVLFTVIKGKQFSKVVSAFSSIENEYTKSIFAITELTYQIELLILFRKFKGEVEKYNPQKKNAKQINSIKVTASEFYKYLIANSYDSPLTNLFQKDGAPKIIHSRSKGVTKPFLGLAIAMALGEYISIDRGGENWKINVVDFLELVEPNDKNKTKGENKTKEKENNMRSPKIKINNIVKILNLQETKDKIKPRRSETGISSVFAFFLQNIKMTIIEK